ncbi:MAG: glycosyltransferase [Arenicella sp.]
MKKKIAIIITRSEIGGAQNYVYSVVDALQQDYQFVVYIGSDGFLANKLRENGIDVHIIQEIDSLNIISACLKLRRSLKQQNPDLINTHSTLASTYGRLASFSLKIPVLYSVHGWFFAENADWSRKLFGPLVERFLARLTNHWITETQFDLDAGVKHKAIPSPVSATVIPNGIEENNAPRDTEKNHSETISLAFIGRISNQKNPSLAIKTMASLPEKYTLTLYCDDASNPALIKLIKECELSSRIDMIDTVKQTASIIHRHDALLVTSLYEGMPLSIIEAMSAGLPIVSTNICGLSELVRHEKNGLLVDSFSATDIAAAIIRIFDNKELALNMGNASRELYLQHHTIGAMASNIKTVYEKLIQDQRH